MNANKALKIAAAVVVMAAISVSGAVSVFSTAGSASDPLVTKKYVDEKVNEILSIIGSGGTVPGGIVLPQTSVDTAVLKNEIIAEVLSSLSQTPQVSGEALVFKPVFLKAGEILIGGEGTELILRSGTSVAFVLGVNGIANVTDGSELYNNGEMKINNLLIIPRDDGRGAKAVTDCWLNVKGSYNVMTQ